MKLFIKHIQLKRLTRRIIIFSLNISKNLLQLSEISCTHLTVIYFLYISNKLSSIIILFTIHSLFIQCTKCTSFFLQSNSIYYIYIIILYLYSILYYNLNIRLKFLLTTRLFYLSYTIPQLIINNFVSNTFHFCFRE